jgi:hypothetical protein
LVTFWCSFTTDTIGAPNDLTTTENWPVVPSSASLLGSWKTEVPGASPLTVRVLTRCPSLKAKKSMVRSVGTVPTF